MPESMNGDDRDADESERAETNPPLHSGHDMARATTWFTPLDRPPYVVEHHERAGAPGNLRVLEISSRSDEEIGRSLSAMRLPAARSDDERRLPVESIYQAAKCYGEQGPGEALSNGFNAKRHDRERRRAGGLTGFEHGGTFWPTGSGSAFYDQLWIKAAADGGNELTGRLEGYDGFSDQFHRPGQSVACQARAAAILVGLERAGRLQSVQDVNDWAATLKLPPGGSPRPAGTNRIQDNARVETIRTHEPAAVDKARKEEQPTGEARILVCGSRDFGDRELLNAKLNEIKDRLGDTPMRVIAGAARGADTLAAQWAASRNIPCDEYPADWERYGKSAGYRRNEQMLNEGNPHLVVAFPQGEARGTRMMMDIAAKASVAVEEVDPRSRNTLTRSGKLYDLRTIVNRRQPVAIQAPSVGAIAKLPNNDPRVHGEARIVIGGVKAGRNEKLVHSKLDEVLARAHPAAVRIAVEIQPGADDLSTVATNWAKRRGVHCDQYRTNDPSESTLTRQRMLAEQKPHLLIAFPRGEQSVRELGKAAARAGIPIEAVDGKGWTHTTTGKLSDLQFARANRNQATPNPAWVVPIERRTAADVNQMLHMHARDAGWAKGRDTSGDPEPTLNLRQRSTWMAVQNGEAIRIDRKTEWGNPVPLRDRNDPVERRENIEEYRSYLANAIDSGKIDIERLAKLDGRKLACHCAPEPCHGGPLSQAAKWANTLLRDRAAGLALEAKPSPEPVPERNEDTIDTHVFDPGSDDFDDPQIDEQRAAPPRPPADEKQHPDDEAADRLEAYRDKLAEAGVGENQLARLEADITTLRSEAEHARTENRDTDDNPMSSEMRRTLDEHNRTVERDYHRPGETFRPPPAPPLPAPAPPPAIGDTREVRVLVTGSWRHEFPAVIYEKLDEVRQRIDGAPMRVVTGDSRGAQKTATQWARDAGVPCDVHKTDWDGAKAQYDADADRVANYDSELAKIEAQYPPDTEEAVPDAEEPADTLSPKQEALNELESAVEWQEAGERAYRREAVRCRDEDMLDEAQPHLVVSFDMPKDQIPPAIEMARERDIPCERIDFKGHNQTPDEHRADLRAIGRRTSDTLPATPPLAPSPAADALRDSEQLQGSRDQTYDTAAR